jgi:hypothetical protein
MIIKSGFQNITLVDLREISSSKHMIGKNLMYHNPHEQLVSNKKEKWVYGVNDYGYRGEWDLNSDKKRIGYFGCSNTFGIGVSDNQTFASLLASKYTQFSHYNLGQPGGSINRILKTFIFSAQTLNLNYAFFNFPSSSRQLIVDEREHYIDLNVRFKPAEISKKAFRGFLEIRNKNTATNEMVTLIDNMILWAKYFNITVFFNNWQSEDNDFLLNTYNREYFFSPIKIVDFGRDKGHPGPATHQNTASEISTKINKILDNKDAST